MNIDSTQLIEYKERNYKLKTISSFIDDGKAFDDWYSWLINDWIINQSDKGHLMALFIKLDFDIKEFLKIVVLEKK